MNSFILLLTLVTFSVKSIAQTEITFEHGTLDEALAKAKKENKPLFVDVWATWCGPCKQMAATSFKEKEVADFYNTNFVSLKLDGEKNDGPEVMRKFGITAYPTLLYFNAKGELVGKLIGGQSGKALLERGKYVVHPELDPIFIARKKYFSSKKLNTDLKEYVNVLVENNADSLVHYSNLYFSRNPKLNLKDEFDMQVFMQTNKDYTSELGQQFLGMVNKVDTDMYLGKLTEYINKSMEEAIAMNEFSGVEKTIKDLFVYVRQVNRPNMPSEEAFLENLRNNFNMRTGK
jgi:thiol-disulfide isomerase/thioredoxin